MRVEKKIDVWVGSLKEGVKDKGIGHWVNGVEEESHTGECGRKEECRKGREV